MVTVHTYNPEEEIWHYVGKLTSNSYVEKLLGLRIEKDFFGLNFDIIENSKSHDNLAEHYNSITSKRELYSVS